MVTYRADSGGNKTRVAYRVDRELRTQPWLDVKQVSARICLVIDSGLVGSTDFGFRESRRWLFEKPTQSQISTSILKYTTIKDVCLKVRARSWP